MDRRHFLGTGTGMLAALAGGTDAFELLQDEEDSSAAFAEFVEDLQAALADTDAAVVDGASALGYGVLLLTTGAAGPGDETFDAELEVVAETYRTHVEGQSEPLAVGLLVEVFEGAEAATARTAPFATYAVPTDAALEALETGEGGAYVSQVRGTVSPPVWAVGEGEGTPAVELLDHELVTVSSEAVGVAETPAVEATVENGGNGRSGTVELLVDWYDAEGSLLETTETVLWTLRPGETWLARGYPLTEQEAVEDYEATVVYDDPEYATPEGLEVAESELSVGGEARISGALENGTGEPLQYVEAIGRVFDAEGRVLGDDRENDLEIEAGATWRFDLRYDDEDLARLDAVDGYEVVPLGVI